MKKSNDGASEKNTVKRSRSFQGEGKMGRILSLISSAFLVLSLAGCEKIEEEFDSDPGEWISFEDVSAPYLETYGPPEETSEYKSSDYHSIDWWWWSQGFMVCFLWTTYDDVYGWTVDHTYSFDPI